MQTIKCPRRNLSYIAAAIHETLDNSASSVTDDTDFGEYSVILPEEPFVFGVSHIKPRGVPSNITKPHYAVAGEARTMGSPSKPQYPRELKSRKVTLGSGAENHIREAAQLASQVRNFAGSLVRVRVHCNRRSNVTAVTLSFRLG